MNGSPGDIAVVNLTPVLAAGQGNGQLISSDITEPPTASNVNFTPGTVDPNVAFAKIGIDGKLCFVNSADARVDLVADQLGTIDADAFSFATPTGAPKRVVETRSGLPGGRMPPSGRVCFAVAGTPGDVAVVNLTPVRASGSGNGQLVSSDVTSPPTASNVNYRPGSVDPNVAFAKIGAGGSVCFINSADSAVDLVADHLGTIEASRYSSATTEGAPKRVVDTRAGLGGRRLGRGELVCFAVAGTPGDIAVVNLTPVGADGGGFGQLVSSDAITVSNTSNVNFSPGSVDPNVALAKIGIGGKVCFINSKLATVDLVADHLGTIASAVYELADPSGIPVRVVDTRLAIPTPPLDHPDFAAFYAWVLTKGYTNVASCRDAGMLPQQDCYVVVEQTADQSIFLVNRARNTAPVLVRVSRNGANWTVTADYADVDGGSAPAWAASHIGGDHPDHNGWWSPYQAVARHKGTFITFGCAGAPIYFACGDFRVFDYGGGEGLRFYVSPANRTAPPSPWWELYWNPESGRYSIFIYESY